MNVKTIDYNGGERRNGTKLKLGFSDYMKVFTFLLTCAIVCIGFYFQVKIGLTESKKDITSQEVLIKTLEVGQVKLDKKYGEEIVGLRANIENIKKDIGNINCNIKEQQIEQKEQRQLLQKIYWELKKG